MLTSREKSVGLFKVAHGDLLGVMFVSVGYIGIFLKKKAARLISVANIGCIFDPNFFVNLKSYNFEKHDIFITDLVSKTR